MKILHTSDWHLGQKFLNKTRLQENEQALDWLLQTISKEQIEVLIMSGDVFDVMNPPNYAQALYYNFLHKIQLTHCRHVVIIGGNHDSPSMLNAPSTVLKTFLNVHVVGCVTDYLEDEIIELRNADDTLEAVVAAVPFLRDADIRKSVAGESFEDREVRIRAGIKNHYHQIADKMEQYSELNIPLIATGHLSVLSKKEDDEKESSIYIGSIQNITPSDFPTIFDYIALGHIHKAQPINSDFKHIRYSGTLIPLNFTEKTKKSITILDFDGRDFVKEIVRVPTFRTVCRIEGTFDEVIAELEAFEVFEDLTAWIEVSINSEVMILNLKEKLDAVVEEKDIEILNFRVNASQERRFEHYQVYNLKTLKPLEVFEQKCSVEGFDENTTAELMGTFKELLNSMSDRDLD